MALEALPASIEALRIAATSPCRRFEVIETLEVPDTGRTGFVFASNFEASRFFFGLSDRRVFTFGPEGLNEVTDPISDRRILTAAPVRDGETWLADESGATFHGHPVRGFVPGPRLPLGSAQFLRLAASPPSAPFELYAATSSIAVFRFEREEWTPMYTETSTIIDRAQLGLVWISPGHVAVIGMEPEAVLEVDVADSPKLFSVPLPLRPTVDVLFSLGWVEGFGALVGSRYSSLFQRVEQDWRVLPSATTTPIVYTIIDLGDGTFIAGGETGRLTQWLPEFGQCPPVPHTRATGHVRFGYPTDEGFAVLTDPIGSNLVITRYRRL